jgi:hypothetical protein
MKNIFYSFVCIVFLIVACNKNRKIEPIIENNSISLQEEVIENEFNISNTTEIHVQDIQNSKSSFVNETVDEKIKQIIIDYKKENSHPAFSSYELKEIRKINIEILNMDCFIIIWKDTYEDSRIEYQYYEFYGLLNSEIIINKILGTGYLWAVDFMFDAQKKEINYFNSIQNFYMIKDNLVLIGDVNKDGNCDIVIHEFGEGGFEYQGISIWGLNKEKNNIVKYLYAYTGIPDNGITIIFNNDGSIRINDTFSTPMYSRYYWDDVQYKYIENR